MISTMAGSRRPGASIKAATSWPPNSVSTNVAASVMYLFASSDGTVRKAVRTNCTTRGGNIGGVYGTTLAVLGVDTRRTSNVSTSANNTTLIVRVST